MVEEPSHIDGPPVPIEQVAYAAKVACEVLSALKPDELRALLTKRAGKGVTAEGAEMFLERLKMAAPCLGLDLETLAEVRAGER
jgi:hypothetical protein